MDKRIQVQKIVKGRGYVGVWTEDVVFISAYISPNVSDEYAEEVLENISGALQEERRKDIIDGA